MIEILTSEPVYNGSYMVWYCNVRDAYHHKEIDDQIRAERLGWA